MQLCSDERGIVVRRTAEQERERDPEACEARARANVNEARLYEKRLRDAELRHCAQDIPIRQMFIFGWVVGDDQVSPDEDEVLHTDSQIVNYAP